MDTYRVIIDGPTDFAVEITRKNGVIYTTGGFHTLLAANAWMADRMVTAQTEVDQRAKLSAL